MINLAITLLRALAAASVFFAVGLTLPLGLIQHTHDLLPACVAVFLLLSFLLGQCAKRISAPLLRVIATVICAYALDYMLVIIGGMGLQIRDYGWQRTNAEGYIKAAFVYGLVFLPLTAPLLWWVIIPVQPALRKKTASVSFLSLLFC